MQTLFTSGSRVTAHIISLAVLILAAMLPAGALAQFDATLGTPGISDPATPSSNAEVRVFYQDGDTLYVGGRFDDINGVTARNIAYFDGTEWHALGAGLPQRVVTIFKYDLGAGPVLFASALNEGLFRWNGSTWSRFGFTIRTTIQDWAVFDDGNGPALYVGGANFHLGEPQGNMIFARLNEETFTWIDLDPDDILDGPVISLQVWDDGSGESLYVGGRFTTVGVTDTENIARWDGTAFHAVGGGLPGGGGSSIITDMVVHDDGSGEQLYIVGDIEWTNRYRVARFNGSEWDIDLGVGFNNMILSAMVLGPPGFEHLFVGGAFLNAPGLSAAGFLARWNGSEWIRVRGGANSDVWRLTALNRGDETTMLLGGRFTLLDGTPAGRLGEYRYEFEDQPPLTGNVVTTTADGGPGSLREMIEFTNSQGVLGDTIKFNIPGPGPHRILLDTPLPDITRRVVIDGATQFGYSNRVPAVIIDGSNLKTGDNGLNFPNTAVAGMLNVVRGLSIVGFTSEGLQGGAAIRLVSDFNVLNDNYIGIEPDGTPNGNGYGVLVTSGSSNRIGLTTANGNVISNNTYGIEITGVNAESNQVRGNLIGTNPAGTEAAGNRTNVRIRNASNNDIGGTAINHRNIISGAIAETGAQHGWGIEIFGSAQNPASGNTIRNNFIGTDITGTEAIPNQNAGINLTSNAVGNTIGGALTDWNLISGQNNGIRLSTSATENMISGNRIGTSADGTTALGNSIGISVTASGNEIGAPGRRNVISGNTRAIFISSGTGTVIRSNFIGTTLDGNAPLPNQFGGIAVMTDDNRIGGPDPADANVISGNARHGIEITNSSPGNNQIMGNLIGLNAAGNAALPNNWSGIQLAGPDNLITGNTISGNNRHGIETAASGTGNSITGNRIGTNPEGSVAVQNGQNGINLSSSGNTVHNNLISGNGLNGIQTNTETGGQNTITGNLIGTDVTGNAALPNAVFGVRLLNSGNIIGTPEPGNGNVISGNGSIGIEMISAVTLVSNDNRIQNNHIGTGLDPIVAVPNNSSGIRIFGGSGNTIGGGEAGSSNIIAWNNASGIVLLSRTLPDTVIYAVGNNMRNNRIYANNGLGIDIDNDGVTENDADGSTNGTNRRQNYPEIESYTVSGNTVTLRYRVPTNPDFAAYPIDVDFYIPDDFGQGQHPVHTDTWAASDYPEVKQITFTIPSAGFPGFDGRDLTATATDQEGNTSEFSPVETRLEASDRFTLIEEFPVTFSAIGVFGDQDIWLVTGNRVVLSPDAGANWTEVQMPPIDGFYSLTGIHLLDSRTAWVYGSAGVVFKTTDGGDNWTQQSPESNALIRHIYFADDQNGWLVNSIGQVYRSASGGETWDEQAITNGVYYLSAYFLNLDTAWLLGFDITTNQRVIRSTADGGENWSDFVFGPNTLPTSLYFMDTETGWAAGQNGLLLSTIDGGTTWQQSEPFTPSNLNTVYFEDEQSGWLGGRSFELLGTGDGGNNWTSEPTGVAAGGQVQRILPAGTGNAIAKVQVLGTTYLFRFESGVQVSIPGLNELPTVYRLEQNYPNPFNPATNIVFELPEAADIRLEVYSVDGRRVTTLLNNRMDAGRHVVPFDASALASGVYLYRISSGAFSQTRKMVLIK